MRESRRPQPDRRRWWNAERGQVHAEVISYVETIEREQFDMFNRFAQLEELYDPNGPTTPGVTDEDTDPTALVIENIVASNVDAVAAQLASAEVRARFMTDGGSWSVQKTATLLEWYVEALGKLLSIHAKCHLAFKEAAKKGTGVVKVYANQFAELVVQHVPIDDIIVDDAECAGGGTPRQLHHRMVNVDREELKARFPDFEDEIDRAQRTGQWTTRRWAGYRPLTNDSLVAIESWKLPIGRKGKAGYRPGRHTIVIDGCTLLDEQWDEPSFPFACMVWSERTTSFYGIGLAERIAGIQRALNKYNWQMDMNLDHFAVPVTYVGMADANLQVQQISRIGTVVVTKDREPKTVIPQANSPEVYRRHETLKATASEESGVNRMVSQGVKPAGVDSAVGMREVRDQSTQRFAPQEKGFEVLVLRTYELALRCCKALGADAPVITRKAKFGERTIKWADVDMNDVRVQIAAASTLARTPAGRYQTALEWAQAGVISIDEWRRLIKHPDLDHILSLYTQGMESVERDLEAIVFDELIVVPEPFGNLLLMERMGQMAYLKYRDLGAPEEILDALRQYVVLAIHMRKRGEAANQNGVPGSTGVPGLPSGTPSTAPTIEPTPQVPQQAAG